MPGHQHADLNQIPVIVMIKDEGNGDPAKPQSQGGEREQPDVAHLKQTTVKGQTDKQKMSSLQQTTFFLVAAHLKQTTVERQTNKQTSRLTYKQSKQKSKQTNIARA